MGCCAGFLGVRSSCISQYANITQYNHDISNNSQVSVVVAPLRPLAGSSTSALWPVLLLGPRFASATFASIAVSRHRTSTAKPSLGRLLGNHTLHGLDLSDPSSLPWLPDSLFFYLAIGKLRTSWLRMSEFPFSWFPSSLGSCFTRPR